MLTSVQITGLFISTLSNSHTLIRWLHPWLLSLFLLFFPLLPPFLAPCFQIYRHTPFYCFFVVAVLRMFLFRCLSIFYSLLTGRVEKNSFADSFVDKLSIPGSALTSFKQRFLQTLDVLERMKSFSSCSWVLPCARKACLEPDFTCHFLSSPVGLDLFPSTEYWRLISSFQQSTWKDVL